MEWGPLATLSGWVSPPLPEGHLPVIIFHNPPIMDWLGSLLNGSPPGRFDVLSPLALAGWVGCFLTALNLLPVGQLDGGHVFNALAPRHARRVSRGFLLLLLFGGVLWGGWVFWAVLLWMMGAWEGLDVPHSPHLTRRARMVGAATFLLFLITFMPRPLEMDSLPVSTPDQAEESE
jgi:membrane-associated protease RseP (regulator of RpoE activity)